MTVSQAPSTQRRASSNLSSRISMLSKSLLAKYFPLNNFHNCSTGLSSGEYGGKNTRVICSGTTRSLLLCHPAPSNTTTRCSLGYRWLISARNRLMVPPFTHGSLPFRSPATAQLANAAKASFILKKETNRAINGCFYRFNSSRQIFFKKA